jgi:hypothetical protein
MAEVGTPTPLLTHAELAAHLKIGSSTIDKYLQLYPKGHPHAFPVERIARTRRYDATAVRAWFAAEADDFQTASTSAA